MSAQSIGLTLWCATMLCVCGSTCGAQAQEPVLATWYGKSFQGRRTASGERYDVRKFTAAHRTLPFGTRLRVCAVKSRRCTVVRVNDRGIGPRFELDLTPAAFSRLARLRAGVVRVTWRLI